MNIEWKKYLSYLCPYRDVLLFLVAMFGANLLWKATIAGDEASDMVTWLGINITEPFSRLANWITHRAVWWLSLIRDNVYIYGDCVFGFMNGTTDIFDDVRISIVWGCTGIKQSFIWLAIMLFARGSKNTEKWSFWSWHKLWFIPLGWLFIYTFNILRIVLIALLIEHHPDMFVFWHEYIFKYMFYGMLFLLWVWWVERIVEK